MTWMTQLSLEIVADAGKKSAVSRASDVLATNETDFQAVGHYAASLKVIDQCCQVPNSMACADAIHVQFPGFLTNCPFFI